MKSLGESISLSLRKWKVIIFSQSIIHCLLFYNYLSPFMASGMAAESGMRFSMPFTLLAVLLCLLMLNTAAVVTGVLIKAFSYIVLKKNKSLFCFLSSAWSIKYTLLVMNFILAGTLACAFSLESVSAYHMFDPRDIGAWSENYIIFYAIILFIMMTVETFMWLVFISGRKLFRVS